MTIGKRRVRTGPIEVALELGPTHGARSYAELNMFTTEENGGGGVTLNCLYIPGVELLEDLFGNTYSFGDDQGDSPTELGESVFWRSADDTLEILRVHLTFGYPTNGLLPVEVRADCFSPPDFDTRIPIHIASYARMRV